jgi:hypothetical protein
MSQSRGSSQIGTSGPIGHPHAIFTISVQSEAPTGQRVGDLWIKIPPSGTTMIAQEDSGGDDPDDA